MRKDILDSGNNIKHITFYSYIGTAALCHVLFRDTCFTNLIILF